MRVETEASLQLPCTRLKGVGPRQAERLAKCGIHSIQDLLFHLPTRYQDRTRVLPIGSVRPGDQAVIEGVIELTQVLQSRRANLLCRIADGTGAITLRFFHFTAAQKANLSQGTRIRCYGEIRAGRNGLEIIHPEYRGINPDTITEVAETLTPIYPATEGLSQTSLRLLTAQALSLLQQQPILPDLLPPYLLERFKLLPIKDALLYVHRPPPDADQALLREGMHPTQQRLAFEELLVHHLSLRRLRNQVRHHLAPELPAHHTLTQQFHAQLPFSLTAAQQRVITEISQDISNSLPMLRLVQGDVGSGKTIVAALAALQALENHYQVALMAPTEILAEQHYRNFVKWLEPLNIQVAFLSGKLTQKIRRQMLEPISTGTAQIIIGTHALFQESVSFKKLGLIIIDEQHRFGVHQRLSLHQKGIQENIYPHQLIMTATPIPRTLAMTAYADLDISIIDELPPGRTPIKTIAVANLRRDEVIQRIRTVCQQQRQVYWVCTLIEESEMLQCQAAEVAAAQLTAALPELRVGLIHGRLKPAVKEQIMHDFKTAQIDLLVATTVIEVGVDVPNASLMIIENPERLGLAQLHQLRGRVGRGTAESHCVLLYQHPLSQQAKTRLAVLRDSNDGFEIARKDLELRGPGEVLGTRQTGLLRLRIADLLRDQQLLNQIQQVAEIILQQEPAIVEPLIRRWLGAGEQYGRV